MPPDPPVQLQALTHYAAALCEMCRACEHRLNAYKMAKRHGEAVAQEMVNALWRDLVAEPREHHFPDAMDYEAIKDGFEKSFSPDL